MSTHTHLTTPRRPTAVTGGRCPRPSLRGGGGTARASVLAREHGGTYDAGDADPRRPAAPKAATTGVPLPEQPPHPVDDAAWRYVHDLDDPRPGEGAPPFGLPVLAEIPGLATVLEQLREADRLIARALEGILLLQDHADVAGITGVGLETWVTTIARRTRADARMLLTAAEMIRRLPTLRAAFQESRLSWAQVRSVALRTRRLPKHLDDRVDAAIASALDGVGGAEPDAVTRVISWSLSSLEPQQVERREQTEEQREFLSLQPRLDGSGGRLWGELGPTSWAVLDAALAQAVPGDDARARAQQLVKLLDAGLAGGSVDGAAPTGGSRSRPQLLLRVDLDSLLDRGRTPGALLTTLLGGHVRISSRTAQRLIDERGADLRTVVLDDTGGVVGVGRRQRVAPGWLRDAVLAVHDTCATPGCASPARTAEMDHARPWHPVHADDQPGTTDIDQLAPVCARHNRRKERDGWQVEQSADGRRRWVHRRSGLHTVTVPATWQRPGDPPPGPEPPEEPGD